MYETKNASGAGANKIISKLPKFNLGGRQQVHDVSQVNATKVSHFGAKKTTALNADLLRLKGGLGTNGKQQQSKSSNSSLTNSETSCGSSLSTNSTASYSNVNRKNNNRKLTFTKSSAASSSVSLNERPRTAKQTSSGSKVISKQPTASNDRLSKATSPVAAQFSAALTKLPSTSKFTTSITSIPKPQIAQRVTSSSSSIQRPAALPNPPNATRSSAGGNLYQAGNLDQKCGLRPYSLKNAGLSNDNYQPYKKPYTRTSHGQDVKLGSALRYPYSESNLKSKLTFAHHHQPNRNEASQAYYKSQLLSNHKKLSSYSGLPVPNGSFRSSKPELRDGLSHKSGSRNNSNSSLNSHHHSHSSSTNHHRQSNDRLHQSNHHFDQSNHRSPPSPNEATTRSLTLENENLASEKENKRLSTSFESSILSRDLSERISQVKAQSKLLNHQNFNNSLNRQKDTQNAIANLQNLVNKKQQQLISGRCKQAPNSIETTEDSNSMNDQSISCTNSQKSASPSSSLTPDISSTSKISPEHNRSDFLIDDEICDQPDLMFLNSKENSTSTSPVKENVSLVDGISATEASQYKTNIRYSITELDSLKLKQELLNQQNSYEKTANDSGALMSSSPEKPSSISQSPVKQFRKPRPLSVVESVDGNLALDGSSFRSVMQDINGIKTLLFRLQGELQQVRTRVLGGLNPEISLYLLI